ncbi:hypothetical protein LZF95_11415 [Algoriphagus sp. AGSA1]|uniref:NAD(P)-dependent oxidoreductase n=1 Tax=Algoriphagus sp. AGSA1 TaxID=2907213 RepID=UPI001F293D58|nr:NAD(P)-dependent oxidoreductase [Algoriphagus sp. AGSA1]MCE7055285.1 hypothetical protein [Algoriphagus sp. AGSA1]
MNTHLLEPDRFSLKALASLQSLGDVSYGEDHDKLLQAEVLFVRLGNKINQTFIECYCPKVKYVLSPTTGHDHLEIEYFEKKGIHLISLRGEYDFLSSISSTAEHTWALLLAMLRNLSPAGKHVIEGGWDRDLFIGNTLKGKKLGILGYGRVGKQVAIYAKAFGMEVHIFDTSEVAIPEGIINHLDFEEFATQVEILSVHIPMTEANQNWLNTERLNLLNSGVKLVNTSRGGVWDEDAVAQLVRSGFLSAVATDVLRDELSAEERVNSALLKCAQDGFPVIITPHIAGACFESMHATEEYVVEKLLKQIYE